MAFLAQCGRERIPMLLVDGAMDDEHERLQALAALGEVSLLKHDPFDDGLGALTVHRVVQSVARARAEARGLAQVAAKQVITRLVAIYPDEGYDDPGCWPLLARLTPHVVTLVGRGLEKTSLGAQWSILLNRAGEYFNGRADYSQAASFLRDAPAIRENLLGPEHPDTAESLNDLALLLKTQDEVAEVRSLYDRALTIQRDEPRVCMRGRCSGVEEEAGGEETGRSSAGRTPRY